MTLSTSHTRCSECESLIRREEARWVDGDGNIHRDDRAPADAEPMCRRCWP